MNTNNRGWAAALVAAWLVFGWVMVAKAQEAAPYQAPRLAEPSVCSIILVPDTQSYAKFARNQGIFDTQTDGGGWHGNGGDGWLRILKFSAEGKRVSVRTFSPLFAISPSTRHLAWRTEPFNQFVFEIGE